MVTRSSKENTLLTDLYINFVVLLLALEYLILLGVRRTLTTEKSKYTLSDFVNKNIAISKVIFD